MTNRLFSCIVKDIKEYLRTKRNILFCGTMLALCIFVMGTTKLLPGLIALLVETSSNTIAVPQTLSKTLQTLFPENLKANLGILAADVVMFYGLVVVLSSYHMLPQEHQSGKWIFPVGVGYHPAIMVFSKGMVYGIGAAFPVFCFYVIYYYSGTILLVADVQWQTMLINAIVLSLSIFFTVYFTVVLSAVCKQPITNAITIIVTIVAAPDILSLFSFGKFFPTHIFTYVYTVSDDISQLIVPLATASLLVVFTNIYVSKKAMNTEYPR